MNEISMTLSSTHIELQNGKGAISASVTNGAAETQQLILAAFDEAGPSSQAADAAAASGEPAEAGTDSTSWVDIENPHRAVGPGKTEQFTVSFDGTGRTAGTHTVKLIAYSADENPEDNRGESATVTVVVPEAEPEEKKETRKIPWWVWAIAAAVLLAIGALVFFLLQRDPEVPNVVDRPVGEAVSVLAENDFRIAADFEYVQSDRPADTVLSQDPAGGARAEAGSTVSLTLAAPRTAQVPGVVGQRAPAAAELITSSGFTFLFPSGAPCTATVNTDRCFVTDQFPAAGSEQPLEAQIVLVTRQRPSGGGGGTFPTVIACPECDEAVLDRFRDTIDPRFLDDDVFDLGEDRFDSRFEEPGRQPR
ncbi:PASTA domain-containing protein [Kocuria rhizosphaericola]|uniref:PASTA domain-containing protein n=1 Tax=Kocuria rhizosphaericola TaxID=3376284 RepID=UPI00379F4BF6